MRNVDLAAELGAKVYVAWGGREGAEYGASQDTRVALDRMKEAFDLLGDYVTDQGYDLRFAIEPKPNDNGQNGPKYDQDLRFGAGNVRGAFWVVDTLLAGGYDGPVHFDYKPARTEGEDGVWVSAAANMRNYLVLREKVKAFRADPDVQEALAAARVPELEVPTLGDGEGWRELQAADLVDPDVLAERQGGFELLDQLALEHLYGVR